MKYLDLNELVENSEEAVELNKLRAKITEDANNELIDELDYEYNKGLSILNNQVVGAEYR